MSQLKCVLIFQISFEPTLTSIENFIKSTCPRILTYIESIPRVDEKLHLKAATDMQPFYEAVGKDEECSQLQALIDKGKNSLVIGPKIHNRTQ